jgi:hypothetical protein
METPIQMLAVLTFVAGALALAGSFIAYVSCRPTVSLLRFAILPLLVAIITSAGCSSEKRYHLKNIPYCQGPDGMSGNFKTHLMLDVKWPQGGSSQQLTGLRSSWDVVYSSSALITIVACPRDEDGNFVGGSAAANTADVPSLCPGQRIVVGPTRVTASDATRSGFDGALAVPKIPDSELACDRGTVAFGDGSPH